MKKNLYYEGGEGEAAEEPPAEEPAAEEEAPLVEPEVEAEEDKPSIED